MNTREMQDSLAEIDRKQVADLIDSVEATIKVCEQILDGAPEGNTVNQLISQQQSRIILQLSQTQLSALKSNSERMKLPEISDKAKDQSSRIAQPKG